MMNLLDHISVLRIKKACFCSFFPYRFLLVRSTHFRQNAALEGLSNFLLSWGRLMIRTWEGACPVGVNKNVYSRVPNNRIIGSPLLLVFSHFCTHFCV